MAEPAAQGRHAAKQFWEGRDVAGEAGINSWMRANDLDEAQLAVLLEHEARVSWIKSLAAFDAQGYFLDQLRVSGDYPRLLERARNKQETLGALGVAEPTLADAGLDEAELQRWYFEDLLARRVPADLDAYWKGLGFASRAAFRLALLREFCFQRRLPARSGNHS